MNATHQENASEICITKRAAFLPKSYTFVYTAHFGTRIFNMLRHVIIPLPPLEKAHPSRVRFFVGRERDGAPEGKSHSHPCILCLIASVEAYKLMMTHTAMQEDFSEEELRPVFVWHSPAVCVCPGVHAF